MSRVALYLGIVLLVIGGIGVVVGMVGVPLQFANTISNAVTPKAEELCSKGETLVTEKGAQEYTPGQGYRQSVRYYCVNAAGVRREVTGSFVTGMLGDVFGSVGTLLIPAVGSCICTVGIILIVAGAFFSRRRAQAAGSAFVFPENP